MPLTVADYFCGTGGLSRGFSAAADFQVIAGIDIRPSAIATFSANQPSAGTFCVDIRKLKASAVAEKLGLSQQSGIDVIVAGPPCQGFSSIRPYRSIAEDDMRNNLFEQLIIHVNFFRPRLVVFENVVGLLKHKNGSILSAIKASFEASGYTTSFGVLNAVHYGVPQRRERLFLLALRGNQQPQLPQASHTHNGRSMAGMLSLHKPMPLFARDLRPAVTVESAIGDLPPVSAGGSVSSYDDAATLSAYARARRKDCSTLTLHSATAHTPRMIEIIRQAGTNRWALPNGLTTSGFSSSYSRLSASEPSTTLTVNFVHPASNRCIHPDEDRALTPREGARLQGFDDDFAFQGSRTQVVKQIGEAVPPLLGAAIARSLRGQLS